MKTKTYILILLMLVAQMATAQTEKRIALVIGNNNYPGKVLKNAVNDAKLMCNTLKDLGFEVDSLFNATKNQMEQAFMNFSEDIKNAKITFIFFSGHGMQIDGINYLMPIDADPQSPEQVPWTAMKINDLISNLSFEPENLNIIVLDACRDDPFRSWVRGSAKGFSRMEAQGTIIGFATCDGCTASDNPIGKNGLYTSKLVEEMNRSQEIIEVFRNTRFAVLKASNNQQRPMVSDLSTGRFYLKSLPEKLPGDIKTIPEDNKTILEFINLKIDNKEYDEALKYIKVAKENDPNNYQLYLVAGMIFLNKGKYDDAIGELSKSLELKGDIFLTVYSLGAAYYNLGADMKAKAYEIQDNNKYYKAIDEVNAVFAKSIPYLEKAYELKPDDIDTMKALKTLYFVLKMTVKYNAIKSKLDVIDGK